MRVLIVEDETAAADNLVWLLRKAVPDVEIAANTESVEQTVEWLRVNPSVDLIFMDIHLSDGSAFSIFEQMEVTVPVVFTTAYDQYALDAFKVNSIDYLLKPVKPEELRRALDKFNGRTSSELSAYLSAMKSLAPLRKFPRRILVAVTDKILPLCVDKIACIYSTNRQTEIILTDASSIPVNKSLEQLAADLDPSCFIRANKQFIISRDAILDMTVWFDSRLKVSLIVDTPEPVYVSKNRVAEFKVWVVE